MRKKKYERPSVEVVVLKQQSTLLAGSMQDYEWEDVSEV